MPKDRRTNSSSFHRAMASPYCCSSKISDRTNRKSWSPHVGNEKEWEEARCSICMEHPHNAVLLLCSSREKGCRPFICDTSYRHSNCLDQFRKSSSSSPLDHQSQLVCPLCRGEIIGWDVIHPARKFMNSKTRNCSLETCDFNGNYAELRKHARVEHPFDRPSEVSPTRQSNWTILEQQMLMEDALAHESAMEYDVLSWDEWHENGLWSDVSSLEFPTGLSDIEEQSIDEIFSGLAFSFMSFYSSFTDDELLDSGSSSIISGYRSNSQVEADLLSYRTYNSVSRSSYHMENGSTSVRSGSSYHTENGLSVSSPRSSYHREIAPASLRTRSSYRVENGSGSRSRSSYHRENVSASSRRTSGYRGEHTQSSPRSRSRYDRTEVGPSVRRSSRQTRSDFRRHEE